MFGRGVDIDLENDSDDLEKFGSWGLERLGWGVRVQEDGGDIGSSGAGLEESSSRGHSWKHVLLVLHQNSKMIQHLLVSSRADDLEFDDANYDADLFSPPPHFFDS